jgi:hypothetical protein
MMMDLTKYTPLYTKLDEEYQKLYRSDSGGWYSRPWVGYRLYDPKIWYLDYLNKGNLSATSQYLIREGRRPRPYYTQIIDLTKSEAELKHDLRKSYKSLVNKHHTISVMRDIEPLRKLHVKCHGRETRSKDTWFVQQKMIWAKEVFCLLQARFPNLRRPDLTEVECGGLFYYNENICYYGVGCSLEGVGSHALIWRAILHAKALGCKEFDMGQQVFGGDEKLVNISKFKKGFGGQTRVYLEFKDE